VLDGTEVVYVERLVGRGTVGVVTRVGSRLPLHATGVGLALLAHAPVDLQELVLSRPLRRYTERTLTDPEQVRRALAEVRRTGVAVSDRQIEMVSLSVAAPVHGADGEVVAALSVVVPADGEGARAFVPVVRAAARGISRALRRR
jgi:DNA-binding IclR family transcriptional regulator